MLLFKKKISINYFLVFIIFLAISMLFFRKITMYFLLILLTATFTYFNYYIKLPFDISPVLILSLIISREYNFAFAVFFILLTGILPMILAGGSFDHTTLFYLSLIIFVNLINIYLKPIPYIYAFIGLILFHHITAFVVSVSFWANPQKEAANLITKIIVDILYVSVAGIVIKLL